MIITVRVVPKSKKSEIVRENENFYRARLLSPPEKGKANRELIQLLARYFGVKKKEVEIIRGEHSREKTVEIKCL